MKALELPDEPVTDAARILIALLANQCPIAITASKSESRLRTPAVPSGCDTQTIAHAYPVECPAQAHRVPACP